MRRGRTAAGIQKPPLGLINQRPALRWTCQCLTVASRAATQTPKARLQMVPLVHVMLRPTDGTTFYAAFDVPLFPHDQRQGVHQKLWYPEITGGPDDGQRAIVTTLFSASAARPADPFEQGVIAAAVGKASRRRRRYISK